MTHSRSSNRISSISHMISCGLRLKEVPPVAPPPAAPNRYDPQLKVTGSEVSQLALTAVCLFVCVCRRSSGHRRRRRSTRRCRRCGPNACWVTATDSGSSAYQHSSEQRALKSERCTPHTRCSNTWRHARWCCRTRSETHTHTHTRTSTRTHAHTHTHTHTHTLSHTHTHTHTDTHTHTH